MSTMVQEAKSDTITTMVLEQLGVFDEAMKLVSETHIASFREDLLRAEHGEAVACGLCKVVDAVTAKFLSQWEIAKQGLAMANHEVAKAGESRRRRATESVNGRRPSEPAIIVDELQAAVRRAEELCEGMERRWQSLRFSRHADLVKRVAERKTLHAAELRSALVAVELVQALRVQIDQSRTQR